MKALTTYFDQTPGTHAMLRIIHKYVISKNQQWEFPMESNDYVTDLPFSNILSIFLKIQSQAFMQVINVSYSRLPVTAKELRTTCINTTSRPEQFEATLSRIMEVFH